MENNRWGWGAGLMAVACWSGFVIVSRLGGTSVLTPPDMMALRFGIGSLVLLPFARQHFLFSGRGLCLALIGGVLYCTAVYQGFQQTTATHAAVLLPGLIPFGAALFSAVLLQDWPGPQRIAGLALIALAGLLMFTATDAAGFAQGDSWLLLAVAAWTLYTVLIRRWKISPLSGAVTTAVGSAGLFLPVYALFLPANVAHAPWSDLLLQGFYQGVIATVVAMLLYLRAVASIGPAAMGALMALVPVVSGLAALPLLNETLRPPEAMALILTSVGAVLASGLVRRMPVSKILTN